MRSNPNFVDNIKESGEINENTKKIEEK